MENNTPKTEDNYKAKKRNKGYLTDQELLQWGQDLKLLDKIKTTSDYSYSIKAK